MMILSAAALLTTACSSSDEMQQQTAQTGNGWSEYITVEAGTPGGADASAQGSRRVAIDTDSPQKSLWETDDKLTIWTGDECTTANMSENGFEVISGAGTGTAKFSGSLVSTSAPTSNTKLIAIIDNDNIYINEGSEIEVSLSPQQYCTAESALDHELFYATSTYANRNFKFKHKMALIKWTIKVNGVNDGDKCDIILNDKEYPSTLASYCYFDANTGEKNNYDENEIILKDVTLTSANSTDLYVVMAPGYSYTGIIATLTMTSGDKAGQKATGFLGKGTDITFEENKFYTAGNEFTPDYEYVDLGLPSGTKWATMNVGASKPEEYGDYFAWGETEPYYSSQDPLTWKDGKTAGYALNWSSYFDTSDGENFVKYNLSNNEGTYKILQKEDDAAYANWGSNWKMPTHAQWEELVANTISEWGTLNSVNGYYFYKKDSGGNKVADTHIFLPAAGYRAGTSLSFQGVGSNYWSSELDSGDPSIAWILYFDDGYVSANGDDNRCSGLPVRPVLVK